MNRFDLNFQTVFVFVFLMEDFNSSAWKRFLSQSPITENIAFMIDV